MTSTKYWLFILLPAMLIGGISGYLAKSTSQLQGQDFFSKAFPYLVIFYYPVLAFLRMRYLKFTHREMLLSFVPFWGSKYRNRVLFDPK
jgi:hypothetical protein